MRHQHKGVVIATAVAGLFLAGEAFSHEAHEKKGQEGAKPAAAVHCDGVNSCKGKSECSGADNACAGKNGCGGKGWVKMTKDECDAAKAKQQKEKTEKPS